MPSFIFDCETNGLLDVLTKLHSLVIRDADTGELVGSFADQEGYRPIREGLEVLKKADKLYAHNGIGFDYWALRKVYPDWDIDRSKLVDTLIVCGLRWSNLKDLDRERVQKGFPSHLAGKHALEAWGARLGVLKGSFGVKVHKKKGEPETPEEKAKWATWSKEMSDYCEQDTLANLAIVRHIRKMGVSQRAVEMELKLAWYLEQQEENGWPFDVEGASKLQGQWSARREEISQELIALFGCWSQPKERDENGAPAVRVSKTRRHIKGPGGLKLTLEAGIESIPIKWVQFNPASRPHIAKVLKERYGWVPTSFTDGGAPEVNEKTLAALDQSLPGVALFNEYLLIEKRLGQLAEGEKAWLRLTKRHPVTGREHIHGRILQNGTVTFRGAHVDPNIGQVPKVGSDYGEECRSLFGAAHGWVQVGADASGIQLRNLAHYMAKWDDGDYGRVIISGRNEDGTDIHSVNRNALGLEGKSGRDAAKTFIYAYLFGAGDQLLGFNVPPKPEEVLAYKADKQRWSRVRQNLAKRKLPNDDKNTAAVIHGGVLRARFERNLPALGKLTEAVKNKAQSVGFLDLPDGRRVPVKHKHTALNYLLQGAEAVICKTWITRFNEKLTAELGPQGWTGNWAALGWIHDEVQLAVRPEYVERVKQILVEEIRGLTQHFGWRVPLDGEAKHGPHWASTH